jgi:Probable cobalt transporter subunit (CbtB)
MKLPMLCVVAAVTIFALFCAGSASADPKGLWLAQDPRRNIVTYTTYAPDRPATAIPLREWLPWAIFAGLILLLAIYFVGAEQGATSLISGMYVHEFVHDGRHLLGFPCH